MTKIHRQAVLHVVFRIAILGKGMDGGLETAGGIVLLLASRQYIRDVVQAAFRHELFEDPNDLVAGYLVQLAAGLSTSTKTFAAIYLLAHGVVKLGLATAIWRNRLWAYPLAGAALFLFVIYQFTRFIFTHSVVLLLLTFVDIVIIGLLPSEYHRLAKMKRRRRSHFPAFWWLPGL